MPYSMNVLTTATTFGMFNNKAISAVYGRFDALAGMRR